MTTQPQQSQGKFLLIAGLVLAIGIAGYYVLNAPDKRNGVQKLGDAIQELPNGPEKAARELEDRTPADKLGDAAKDARDDMKKSINQQ